MNLLRAATLAALLFLPACTGARAPIASRCEAIEIDPSRELIVTDGGAVGDPRVGFGRVMGAVLAAHGGGDGRAWMAAWAAAPGEESVASEVLAAWAAEGQAELDLSRAPFELVAIVNRVDLATLGPSRKGELRFVYGLVTAGMRRPLTVNVEIALPETRTVEEWGASWHALGSLTGGAYQEALMSLVGAALDAPPLGQIRTQDARGASPLLLEFDLRQGQPLAPGPLFDQPSPDVRGADLAAFVSAHQDEVVGDREVLPASMLATSALSVPPSFPLPGVPADLAAAFANTTCSGCHTAEATIDGTFHVSPLQRGAAALSPFLTDAASGPSELDRRAEVLRGVLCEPASGSGG